MATYSNKTFDNVCKSLHMGDSQKSGFHEYMHSPQLEGTTVHLGYKDLRELAQDWMRSSGSEHTDNPIHQRSERSNKSDPWSTAPEAGGKSGMFDRPSRRKRDRWE